MDSKAAKEKFDLANQLFRQARYEEALSVLTELNSQFPNTKNVMYPAALCMEKLGRIEEAKFLCHTIIRNFDYQKARELLNYLEVAPRIAVPAGPVPPGTPMPGIQRQMPGAESGKRSNRNAYLIVGVLLAVTVLLVLPFFLTERNASIPTEVPETGSVTGSTAIMLPVILICLVLYLFGCYLMKRICEHAGSDPGVLIWIPILQIIPMMRAADMSFIWLLALLIPVVGGLVFTIVFWVKLLQACNKPGWWVILLFIPLANFLLLLYLAFTTPE